MSVITQKNNTFYDILNLFKSLTKKRGKKEEGRSKREGGAVSDPR
jgi:hypothetical protein